MYSIDFPLNTHLLETGTLAPPLCHHCYIVIGYTHWVPLIHEVKTKVCLKNYCLLMEKQISGRAPS